MSKITQRWEWAIGLKLEELNDQHLQAAYKLNWDNLCKFDNCRKNCKRILCLACFDKSWIDDNSAIANPSEQYETAEGDQKRVDLKSFVGLKNLGATCYVNCLLQLWFHNPALRKAIYEWDGNSNSGQEEEILLVESTNKSSTQNNKDCDSSNGYQQQNSKLPSKRQRDDDHNVRSQKSVPTPAKKLNSSKTSIKKEETKEELKLLATKTSSKNKNCNQPAATTKSADSVQTKPIEQLQLIFARLQFTNKKSLDPQDFIDSLALNAAEQQDAQEFGNLFMELLERTFANHKNSFVSKIIQRQFRGRYSYATICDICHHSSLSDSNFYELDLSIQNLETLYDCLNEYFRPVPLDGNWHCDRCDKAQSAHRKIILKSLPPTLNLQLLRFVYDVQRNNRQKLNSYVIFPEILDMTSYLKDADLKTKTKSNTIDLSIRSNSFNNSHYLSSNGTSLKTDKSNIYILSAVLIHRGSSPHSGHYIAHIKDRITKDWYKFNDDSVERIGPQLQVSTDGENITIVEDKTESIKTIDSSTGKVMRLESKSLKSKTAYMLVYQAQDNEALSYPSDNSEEWQLPDHLQTAVAEENSRSDEMFESLQLAIEEDQQLIAVRKNQIRCIYEKLVCRDPKDEFEFINKSWLQRWLTDSSPVGTHTQIPPIDNSGLLCIHDKLDFRKLDQVKCVRSEGVDMLYKEFGLVGPRLQNAMCRSCVELEVKLIQLKDRLKEDQKFITSQAKFKLDANYDFADAYIVGKNSYRDWQALVMVQFEKSYPELRKRERELLSSSGSNQQVSSDEDEKSSKDHPESTKQNNDDNSNSESDDEAIERFVFNSDILCEHNQLINDMSAWRIVPKEVWAIFKNYFGNDPSRPLIERNANTIMCSDCKRQEAEQQEIGGIQKQKALEQKSKLPDLFHMRKRASWCSMLPKDIYYAIDRQFLIKWQKFIRNPCHQEQPTVIKNRDRLVCEHGKSLYNYSNSNPVLQECPFVLVKFEELTALRKYYPIDFEIKFTIDPELADQKLKLYLATLKTSLSKKITVNSDSSVNSKQVDQSGDNNAKLANLSQPAASCETTSGDIPIGTDNQTQTIQLDPASANELDLTEIDWSECVISEPDFCSDCHEMLKLDELKKLLNYESATIYITKVENSGTYGPQNNPNLTTNGGNPSATDICDNEANQALVNISKHLDLFIEEVEPTVNDQLINDEQHPKRRKKGEDEGNDFVPPGTGKQPARGTNSSSNSILRRTTRRNRNREQAYTIKPTQTLLQLKKEIYNRCQVIPSDQRLFLNDVLLDDSNKTMSELRIVPNCSLKLEVDRPMGDSIDLIEDEPMSRKSCAQPETGFKGSLLLSNSHF